MPTGDRSAVGHDALKPIANVQTRFAAGQLGMWLFLLSLAMVFGASIVAYVIVRMQLVSEDDWRPDNAPGLPSLLFVSTGILLVGSLTLALANRSASQGGSGSRVGGWMLVTCVFLFAFLVTQTIAWIELVQQNLMFDESLYAWMFYVLTGLHALHVIAGLPPAFVTTRHAFQGHYSTSKVSRAGLIYCGMYWHFLDAVWIVLYLVLLWGMRTG